MLAKITGIFRLTRDLELRYGTSGNAIAKLGLACSEKFKDKETTLFLDAVAFSKPAEILNQYAGTKGTQLFLSGKLQTESWETDGQKRSKVSMVIESFEFVGKKSESQCNSTSEDYNNHSQRGANAPVNYEQPQNNQQRPVDDNMDNVPF